MSFLSIPLFWGRLNLKWRQRLLFSERLGYMPFVTLGPLRVSWVRYRRLPDA